MNAVTNPNPFPALTGFNIEALGGTPPYQFTPMPSPPNPAGVTIVLGPPVHVSVPSSTSPGSIVQVMVTDSSDPQETTLALSVVA